MHSYDPNLIDQNSVVLDLGAHKGDFSREILNKFNCRVIAFEPLPDLCQVNHPKFTLINAAVYGYMGDRQFTVYKNFPMGGSILGKTQEFIDEHELEDWFETPTLGINEIFHMFNLNQVDLMKIDIEGSEYCVLDYISRKNIEKIKQLSVEFHHEWADEFYLPEFTKDTTLEIIQKLEKHYNFKLTKQDPRYVDCLFINQNG